MEKIKSRLREPSTWASLAAGVAIMIGQDPTMAADAAIQVAGGLATLAGIFLAENKPEGK